MQTFRVPKGFDTSPIGVLEQIRLEVIRQASLHAVEVVVKKYQKKRSDEQNRLLWSLYTDILQRGGEMMGGWTKDDLHELFLGTHFGWEVIQGFGQKRKKPLRRSSKLNTVEFAEFVDFIVRYMAEQGVCLKMPGDIVL